MHRDRREVQVAAVVDAAGSAVGGVGLADDGERAVLEAEGIEAARTVAGEGVAQGCGAGWQRQSVVEIAQISKSAMG
ncbi:MAG: hypothetical protein IPG43_05590 [Proteobacteria bacterium]|nr:hypothetical protein [Pseudomonadota bacterium]